MKFGQSILRKINCGGAAGRLNSRRLEHTPKVHATESWSNPETVGDLMGEVRARCIETLGLSATTSSMEVGTLQRQQTL